MADNVLITPGSGDTIAADDIGGNKYQRIKIVHGADGTNDGDVSDANPLPVKNFYDGIGHGVKTVTTAGTDVVLASSTACKRVVIQAQTDNTGLIAVGASGVDATEATGDGIILYAGDSIEMDIDNLADIFIDSTVSGDGVRYIYFT